MSTVSSPAALPQYIEKLLTDRHAHVTAIATIDATMHRVTVAIGGSAPKAAAPKPVVAKKAVKKVAAKKVTLKKVAPKAPVAKAVKSGMTANEFVLSFIKAQKNPTSQDIAAHWKKAGRKGMADNSLSVLTKSKTLKRIPLGEGIRGSRYSIA
jgi:hypothetical protein